MAEKFFRTPHTIAPVGAVAGVWANVLTAWWYYYASQPEGVHAIA